jgi:hypothetical protein
MVKQKKMIAEQESTSNSDPYSLFLHAIKSLVTRDRYTTRLRRIFFFIGSEGKLEEKCRIFIEKSEKDIQFAF